MISDETALSTPVTGLEKVLAGCAHGSIVLGIPFLVPLATLLFATLVQPSAYVKNQSLQAIAFHFLMAVIFGALILLAGALGLFAFFKVLLAAAAAPDTFDPTTIAFPTGALLVFLAALLFGCWASIIALVATIRGFQGRPYRYPLIGALFN